MSKIELNIPTEKLSRVIDGICGNLDYQAEISDSKNNIIPNPETKGQFAKRMIVQMIKDHVVAYEKTAAQETAINNISNEIESINIT